MTFRQNALLITEYRIMLCVLILSSLMLIPAATTYAIMLVLLFTVLLLLTPQLCGVFITMNEEGITAYRGKKQLWVYNWEQIKALKKSNRYLLPSVEIIATEYAQRQNLYCGNYYFQLGKIAKEALQKYCQLEITK